VPAEVLHVIDLPDDALGVNEECPAPGDCCPVVVRRASGPVGLADRVVDVRQEAVGEALGVGERLVLVRRVERDPDDDGVGVVEL